MKISIIIFTALSVTFTVYSQIRYDPKLAVKEGEPHYMALMEKQELIKHNYGNL